MTGYDRARSAHTTRGISTDQLAAVREAARSFQHPAWFAEINAGQLVEFLYLTACHPSVVAHPARHHLRYEARVDGCLHVLWTRPKKRGLAGETDLPIAVLGSPEARWIPRFIDTLRARSYEEHHLARLLRSIGKLAGVPLSARVLRHTRGVDVAQRSRDPAMVAFWLNCSVGVAAQYLRLSGSSDPRALALAAGRDPSLRAPGAPSY